MADEIAGYLWLDLPKRMDMDGFWWFLQFSSEIYIYIYISEFTRQNGDLIIEHEDLTRLKYETMGSLREFTTPPAKIYLKSWESPIFIVLRAPTPLDVWKLEGNSTRKQVAFTAQWIDTKQKKNRLQLFFFLVIYGYILVASAWIIDNNRYINIYNHIKTYIYIYYKHINTPY